MQRNFVTVKSREVESAALLKGALKLIHKSGGGAYLKIAIGGFKLTWHHFCILKLDWLGGALDLLCERAGRVPLQSVMGQK